MVKYTTHFFCMFSAHGHIVPHPLGCKLRSTYITDNKKAGQAPAFLLSELHKTDILALAAIMFVIIFCRMKRVIGIDTSRFLFFIIDTTTSSLRFLVSNLMLYKLHAQTIIHSLYVQETI